MQSKYALLLPFIINYNYLNGIIVTDNARQTAGIACMEAQTRQRCDVEMFEEEQKSGPFGRIQSTGKTLQIPLALSVGWTTGCCTAPGHD